MRFVTTAAAALVTLTSALHMPAFAQESAESGSDGMALELNRIAAVDGGCQVVFFGQNGSDEDFAEVEWRLAVFDAEGVFKTLLALPLGALAPGKRRVVQYNLPFACNELSEIIVNDVAKCTLAGGGDSDTCLSSTMVTSRTDIAFGL